MILHVLPGDSLVETFNASSIEGEVAVCRECLVEGDVSGETLPEFWENRARFLSGRYDATADDYHETVVHEFAKLTAVQSGSEINLWFEYELFCQANMWFCLSLIANSTSDIFRVAPATLSEDAIWDGFGNMTPDNLRDCFAKRIKLTADDIKLGADLWAAYREQDAARLAELSTHEPITFPKLKDVTMAAIEKETLPRQILDQIVREGKSDFGDIFLEFKSRAGVYGYGDSQVRNLLSTISPRA
ncbi:MAG: DUF1835 domain-containing protein [Acidobacteria bacterium]|nr:MAG: DUF1835 domain-containing protein [Acidobacteriota bacterium]